MSVTEPAYVDVIKLNPQGEETWRYPGKILVRGEKAVLLEAFFNRKDRMFHGIFLRVGDRFVEAYFSQRGYNIFAMYDVDDGHLKGWYCNVTRPALFEDSQISYVDLALDLLVYPDGSSLVLDEDEFAELNLSAEEAQFAWDSLAELKALFASDAAQDLERLVREG